MITIEYLEMNPIPALNDRQGADMTLTKLTKQNLLKAVLTLN